MPSLCDDVAPDDELVDIRGTTENQHGVEIGKSIMKFRGVLHELGQEAERLILTCSSLRQQGDVNTSLPNRPTDEWICDYNKAPSKTSALGDLEQSSSAISKSKLAEQSSMSCLMGLDLYDVWKDSTENNSAGSDEADGDNECANQVATLCTLATKHFGQDLSDPNGSESFRRVLAIAKAHHEAHSPISSAASGRSVQIEARRSLRRRCLRCDIVMQPLTSQRVAWDVLGTIALAWDLFQVPLAVFDPPVQDLSWVVIAWISAAFWTMDIPASCLVGYFDGEGNLEMGIRPFVCRYLKTWCVFDMIMISLDYMSLAMPDTTNASKSARAFKLLRFLRALRLIRLLKATKLKDTIFALQEQLDSPLLDPIIAMFSNAFMILCVAHFVACCWYAIGSLYDEQTWVSVNQMNSMEFWMKYLMTYRMALTFCFGRNIWIQPENILENVFMVVMKLVGLMVFSTFVGGVTSRLTKIRDLVAQESVEMYQLKQYLREKKASMALRERVLRYAKYAREQHKQCRQKKDVALLGLISGPLHIELESELNKPYLSVCPLFKEYDRVSAAALSQVCYTCLGYDTYARKDVLFTRDRPSERMFFVKMGAMGYKMPANRASGNTASTIVARRGHWFCELCLWTPWVHRSKMRALIESDIITLNAERFRSTTANYDDALAFCRAHASEMILSMQRNPDDRWDVPMELIYPQMFIGAGFHKDLSKIANVHPLTKRQAEMVEKAGEITSLIMNEDSDDDFNELVKDVRLKRSFARMARPSYTKTM